MGVVADSVEDGASDWSSGVAMVAIDKLWFSVTDEAETNGVDGASFFELRRGLRTTSSHPTDIDHIS